MAHYAKINSDNIVERVIVVSNDECCDANGNESEAVGAAFCAANFGGRWIQTSFSGKIRNVFAAKGFTYNEALDVFVPPKPYPSWVLDESTSVWSAPVPEPVGDDAYRWDEATLSWVN